MAATHNPTLIARAAKMVAGGATHEAVASALGITARTLRRWKADGRLGDDAIDAAVPAAGEDFAGIGWRDWVAHMDAGQRLRRGDANWGLRTARIDLAARRTPLLVVPFGDQHLSSWGTDHMLFLRFTEWVLETEGVALALTGDLINLTIKLRNVLEVKDDMLPPEVQHDIVADWLGELAAADKVLFACMGNHDAEREDGVAGASLHRRIMQRAVPFFSGIGHCNVTVGAQVYKFAIAHRFRGSSQINPLSGHWRYVERQDSDREILIAGDLHKPEMGVRWLHNRQHIGISGGTLQTRSDYGQKFSLEALAEYPCVELHPDRHAAIPFANIAMWMAATRRPEGIYYPEAA